MTDKNIMNNDIQADVVILINEDKKNLGKKDLPFALNYAKNLGLDLVQVSSSPTVCRIMDYNKEMFHKSKAQNKIKPKKLKEIKIRPNITDFDLGTKVKNINRLLSKRHKVKVSVVFRGRELNNVGKGFELIESIKNSVDNLNIDSEAKLEGRSINMILS